MSKVGKRYLEASKSVDTSRLYSIPEAVALVKETAKAKFDETIDLAVRLGVDPRRADQIVRGSISLPNGTGKTARVAVFATGDLAMDARNAGADVIGADDLITRIEKENFLDFDVVISTPELMALVGRLGRVLGPRGLMPNPKTGTVTNDIGKTVAEYKAGKIEYRTDRVGNIHAPVGKASFSNIHLVENVAALLDELIRAKPSGAKGKYIRSITLSSTMGPGVKIDTNKTRITEEDLALTA
ncbi:MAG: 50S ribosomal protein L1 [Firmicutes bacterium]|jgi:large subunit ribosomal protein L1|nr:50S ribosomal protein L1 [Bacillota bacterium]